MNTTRTREEIETDIQKLSIQQTQLQTQLSQLDSLETIHLRNSSEDVINGTEGTAAQNVVNVRIRRESVNTAIATTANKIQSARLELQQIEYAEAKKVWEEFENDCWKRLEAIQGAIGSDGAKGLLDEFNDLLKQAQAKGLGTTFVDGTMKLDRFLFIYVEAARALFAAWKIIEQGRSYQPNHISRPDSDILTGFGKLP